MTYLTEYYDPALKPGELKREEIVAEEMLRLQTMLAIAEIAAEIPRRLGPEATGEELAADKQRCRRIRHVAQQLLASWDGKTPKNGVDFSKLAATVNWDNWWADHQVWLRNRRRAIATWGMTGGDEKFAKSAVVRYNNEERWLQYALRR